MTDEKLNRLLNRDKNGLYYCVWDKRMKCSKFFCGTEEHRVCERTRSNEWK